MFHWKEILDMGRDIPDRMLAERQRSCREDHIVTILYTSGTTGAPKGRDVHALWHYQHNAGERGESEID